MHMYTNPTDSYRYIQYIEICLKADKRIKGMEKDCFYKRVGHFNSLKAIMKINLLKYAQENSVGSLYSVSS